MSYFGIRIFIFLLNFPSLSFVCLTKTTRIRIQYFGFYSFKKMSVMNVMRFFIEGGGVELLTFQQNTTFKIPDEIFSKRTRRGYFLLVFCCVRLTISLEISLRRSYVGSAECRSSFSIL